MRYFLTLNIQSDYRYENIVEILEKNNIEVLGVDGVTEYQSNRNREQSLENATKALKEHKRGLKF